MENSKEVYEFLLNLLLIRKSHVKLLCGSASELPIQYVIANATDVDVMYIPTDICALPVNVSAPHTFQGKTLVVNTEGTYPGFARLYAPNCKRLYRKQEGVLDNHHQHGPAWTTMMINSKHINFVNLICGHFGSSQDREIDIYRRLLEMKIDRVFAIYCPCWPTVAEEWKTRERPNGWPPVEIIDKIVASGCYFFAKPHPSSPSDDTQWRSSFSQAEVILVHSWTGAQKYIYHILRLIKDDIVKACGGSDETNICTYFFKTLMFWECERKPKEFWNDENVENSVMELLRIMIVWLIDGCCPNYFIRMCNMMSTSTDRVDFTKDLQLLLSYALSDITKITTKSPRAYAKHALSLQEFAMPERVLLYIKLMQVRDNYLHPLYPKTKTHLLKQLTETNSFLWRQASYLYSGIVSHLQFMKTRCPVRKNYLKRIALSHFMSSLKENGDECSKVFLSIGESVYEGLERFIRDTDCSIDSSRMRKDTCKDSCEMHVRGNCLQSVLNTPVNCNFSRPTHERFVPHYSRQLESSDDDLENKISSHAAIDNLNTSVRGLLQIYFSNAVDSVTTSTHVISSVYLANFYYTASQDYNKVSALCNTVIHYPEGDPKGGKTDLTFSERAFPIFITNELSTIFDEHFGTVLGIITLHRSTIDSLQDNSTILIRICSAQFLKYLRIQCKRCEGLDEPEITDNFKRKHAFNKVYDTYEPLSEVFMSAVLHASRCKFQGRSKL